MASSVRWQGKWQTCGLGDKAAYFLGELRWEIETNTQHPLYEKECVIVGWIPGYDDFILWLPKENRHAYIHLTWNAESSLAFPHTQFFAGVEELNDFLDKWNG